ncbi:MAG TPA: sigma-70 family RNA polymerase sigma factor [Mycobacteriales bacterium]|nr:sigma-70 family RNA polymerase sigma factor [Mycobacteriales bacterium]
MEPNRSVSCQRGVLAGVSDDGELTVAEAHDLADHYREHWPALVRLGRLLTGSQAAGEEIAQEAYLGLLRATSPVANPAAYLRRAVVNLSINVGRRAKNERTYLAKQREPLIEPPDFDEMWGRLRRLPAKQRAVLVLRFYEDLSAREIAGVMGCKPGTVKSLSSRGLDQLRKDLS